MDANFEGADLRGASLEKTNLEGVSLKNANLGSAYFSQSLKEVDNLSGANMAEASFPPNLLPILCEREDVLASEITRQTLGVNKKHIFRIASLEIMKNAWPKSHTIRVAD